MMVIPWRILTFQQVRPLDPAPLADLLGSKSNFAKALNYYHSLAPYRPTWRTPTPDSTTTSRNAASVRSPLAVRTGPFVGSEDGGKASATILSLVQTCRNLGINPHEYLEDVLRRIMRHSAKQDTA
jgi:transposase